MAFFAINDYSSMLNRIGWGMFAAWTLAILTLNQSFEAIRNRVPQVIVTLPDD